MHRSSDLDSREVHKGCMSQAGPLRKTRPKEWYLSIGLSISLPTYVLFMYHLSISSVICLSVFVLGISYLFILQPMNLFHPFSFSTLGHLILQGDAAD